MIPPSPMLAYPYSENNILYPTIIQPKLNGVRCLLSPEGKCYSRSGLQFRHYEGVFHNPFHDIWLDGEIWRHDVPFQEIAGELRSNTRDPALNLQFYVFDVVLQEPQRSRLERLHHIVSENVFQVAGILANRTEARAYFAEICKTSSYDGIIYRNPTGFYQEGRSRNLHKRKRLITNEFKCVGIIQGLGKFKGMLGAFILELPAGGSFKCGGGEGLTNETRAHYWQHPPIGKYLTIAYPYTSTDNTPQTPQFIAVRDYE